MAGGAPFCFGWRRRDFKGGGDSDDDERWRGRGDAWREKIATSCSRDATQQKRPLKWLYVHRPNAGCMRRLGGAMCDKSARYAGPTSSDAGRARADSLKIYTPCATCCSLREADPTQHCVNRCVNHVRMNASCESPHPLAREVDAQHSALALRPLGRRSVSDRSASGGLPNVSHRRPADPQGGRNRCSRMQTNGSLCR
jgi:hypothetical protein